MSERPTCVTGCGRPTRDVLLLCDGCRHELERALGDLPALLDELKTTLTRQAKTSEGRAGGKPTKASEQPLPFNVAASKVLDDLRVYLVGWVMVIHEAIGDDLPADADSLRAMSRWLLWRLDALCVHEAAGDLWDELVGVVRQARRVIDRSPHRTSFPVGPCPETHDMAACPGEVRAYIPASAGVPARMACTYCDREWLTHEWLRAGRRILDRKSGVA